MEEKRRTDGKDLIPFRLNLRFWDHHSHTEKLKLPLHSHLFWQLNIVEKGYADFIAPDKKFQIKLQPGDFLFGPPGCSHRFRYYPEACIGFSFKMEVHGLKDDDAEQPIHIPSSPETFGCVRAIRELMFATFPIEASFSREIMLTCDDSYSLLLESLLIGIFRRYAAGTSQDAASPLLRTIRQMLQQRHGNPLTVKELAQSCHYSAGHLSELLHRECGLRAKPLIDRERTVIAANFLEFSEMNISEIAEYMGFPNVFAFSTFFRHHTGSSPAAYRDQKRNELPGSSGPAIRENQ